MQHFSIPLFLNIMFLLTLERLALMMERNGALALAAALGMVLDTPLKLLTVLIL